jgi:predicted DNA-binding transcriptional regulator AlpA
MRGVFLRLKTDQNLQSGHSFIITAYTGIFTHRSGTEEQIMVQKRFYNIQELATILGKSVAAIHGHLSRKQFDAVPPPMRLGRRLAWLVEYVDDWIETKADKAVAQAEKCMNSGFSVKLHTGRRGRPTKLEQKARERSTASSG